MRSKKELRDSCEALIRYIYKETLIEKGFVGHLFIIGDDNNVHLSIDQGFRYAGEDKVHPPRGPYKRYCTLTEYLIAEGDFVSVAKEKK